MRVRQEDTAASQLQGPPKQLGHLRQRLLQRSAAQRPANRIQQGGFLGPLASLFAASALPRGQIARHRRHQQENQQLDPDLRIVDRQGVDRLDEEEVVGQEGQQGRRQGRPPAPADRAQDDRQQVDRSEVRHLHGAAQNRDQGRDCCDAGDDPQRS